MKLNQVLSVIAFAGLGLLLAAPSSARVSEGAAPTKCEQTDDGHLLAEGDDAIALGSRDLGESCTKDCQCESRECKGFKCVKRNLAEHPLAPKGAACVFDGDCASCDCARGSCK